MDGTIRFKELVKHLIQERINSIYNDPWLPAEFGSEAEVAGELKGYKDAIEILDSIAPRVSTYSEIKIWVARDKDGMLACSDSANGFTGKGTDWWIGTDFYLPSHLFPEITWESEPVKMEFSIRKI